MSRFLIVISLVMSFIFINHVYANSETANPIHEGIEITVNINTAGAEELATLLKGVGTKKAQAIVSYRESNGHFMDIEELANVKGIGASIIEKNRDRILL